MPRETVVQPTQSLVLRLMRGTACLDDFLGKGDFVDAMFAARWRIIRVFAHARTAPRRQATTGYILGCDDKLTSLATYIQRVMGEAVQAKIYKASDLPASCRNLPAKQQRFVIDRVRFELYVRILEQMQEANDLWYMAGEWVVPQHVMDEFLLREKAAKVSYVDQRPFHGHPNTHRARQRRLGIAPGVSCGLS